MAGEPENGDRAGDGSVPATAARQGRTNVGLRQMLGASLVLVILGLILAWFLA